MYVSTRESERDARGRNELRSEIWLRQHEDERWGKEARICQCRQVLFILA